MKRSLFIWHPEPNQVISNIRLSTFAAVFFSTMLGLQTLAQADSGPERDLHPVLLHQLDLINPASRGEPSLRVSLQRDGIETGPLDIISGAGVKYDLGKGKVQFDLSAFMFCLDFSEPSAALRIEALNPANLRLIDIPMIAPLSYQRGSKNLSTQLADTTQCFIRDGIGADTRLLLLGPEPEVSCDASDPDCPFIFRSRFKQPSNDQRSLEVSFDAPQQVRVGELVTYSITLTNTGEDDIETLGFQELLTPSNPAFADAFWNISESLRTCQPSNLCGNVRAEPFHLRGNNLSLPAGATITINVTREVWAGDSNTPPSQPGAFIELLAGAVAGDHTGSFPPAHAAAVARIQVVADGTFIFAERLEDEAALPVTDSLDDGFNIRVNAQDSSSSGSIPLQGLAVELAAVCEFIDSGACVEISKPELGFLVSPPQTLTDENGFADFQVSSERPGRYRLTFEAPSDSLSEANFVRSQDNVATVEVEFSPGAGHELVFVSLPDAVSVDQAFAVEVQIQDEFGNLLNEDNSTEITLELETGPVGAELSGSLDTQVTGGVATFTDLSVNKSGGGYQLRASVLDSSYVFGSIGLGADPINRQIEVEMAGSGVVSGLIFSGEFGTFGSALPEQTRLLIVPPAGAGDQAEISGGDWGFADGCTTNCISDIILAFPSGTADEGEWSLTFTHDVPDNGVIGWNNPAITLIREPLSGGLSDAFMAHGGD